MTDVTTVSEETSEVLGTETTHEPPKEHAYYIIFKDDHNNYVAAYGFELPPNISEMNQAVEVLKQDPTLKENIPNFLDIIDYICFDVMTHAMFSIYMAQQATSFFNEVKAKKELQ